MLSSPKRIQHIALVFAMIVMFLSVPVIFAAPLSQELQPTIAQPGQPTQQVQPTQQAQPEALQEVQTEVAVLPADLERLSWGAVIAGSIFALIIQIGLNLLGVGIGLTQIAPDENDPSPDLGEGVKNAGRTGIVWIGFSTLVSLFAGGWLAARFAGIPNDLDGMLHGLLVWGLVTLVLLLLISSTAGRLLSGISNLVGQGVALAARLTGAAAQGAVSVAGAAASGAANVAGAAVQGVSNVAGSAVDTAREAAYRARPQIDQARQEVESRVQEEINRHPEMKQALSQQNLSRQRIEQEARTLLEQAGVPPQRVEGTVNAAAQDIREAADEAMREVREDPRMAADTMIQALGRVLDRARDAVSDVDRDSVVDVIKARTGRSDEEARQLLMEWENRFYQARGETDRVRSQVESQLGQRVNEIRGQVEGRVADLRHQVEDRATEIRDNVEQAAVDATRATAKAISRLALAAFAAILIGGIAAGIGGLVGAPEELPVAQIDTDDSAAFAP
ncbi:MAG: hypothetical protein SF162_01375 [bacterium]|nr:hypothetical protein [bacterium]